MRINAGASCMFLAIAAPFFHVPEVGGECRSMLPKPKYAWCCSFLGFGKLPNPKIFRFWTLWIKISSKRIVHFGVWSYFGASRAYPMFQVCTAAPAAPLPPTSVASLMISWTLRCHWTTQFDGNVGLLSLRFLASISFLQILSQKTQGVCFDSYNFLRENRCYVNTSWDPFCSFAPVSLSPS